MPMNHPSSRHRAFTIVELLVVLVIIGIVLSILLPAIAGARTSAKRASTTALINQLTTATNAFTLDRSGKMPGYFSAADMGNSENATRGFSAMKNLLLDLSGGLTTANAGGSVVQVGPLAASTVNVDLVQIGASTGGGNTAKSYFTPDRAFYVAQNTIPQQFINDGAGIPQGHKDMPEIVDSWGNPILAWVQDDRATNAFAAQNSNNANTIAKFYWSSNACYLGATSTGKSGRNQFDSSLIGGTGSGAYLYGNGSGNGTFEAMLGNPAYPTRVNPIRPEQARGPIVFHSAAQDGFYLGRDDRGGKIAAANTNLAGAVPYSTTDAMGDFDDILVKTGN